MNIYLIKFKEYKGSDRKAFTSTTIFDILDFVIKFV